MRTIKHVQNSGWEIPDPIAILRMLWNIMRGHGVAQPVIAAFVPGADSDDIPSWLRAEVYRRDGHTCRGPRCGATTGLSVDHVKPRHHGGLTWLPNLQTLCTRCNSSKGARLNWKGRRDLVGR